MPEQAFLKRGILASAEGAECVGGQLGRSGDRRAALFAALFVDHLQRTYPDSFEGAPRWNHRLPGDLGHIVCQTLNQVMDHRNDPPYRHQGIEAVTESLCSDPVVRKFLGNEGAAQQALAAVEPLGK
jgi:hypothetical protein